MSYSSNVPILRKETEIHPDDLFNISTETAPWEIALLRSRHEKAVARVLADAGIPFYLPQVKQTTVTSGRTHVSHLPLFPGYIFVRRVDGLKQVLWRTKALASIIDVPDQAQLTSELQQIRQLQESGAILTPRDAAPIKDGTFVSLSILGQSFAVEYPTDVKLHVK